MQLIDKLFLGPEFLTWLYFHLLDEGMEIELPEAFVGATANAPPDNVVRFAIAKKLKLRDSRQEAVAVALSGAGMDDNGEILQAVSRGALIESLSLEMAVDSRVYSFTMDGKTGGLTGVKLPDLFTDPDEDEKKVADPALPPKKERKPKLPFDDVLTLRLTCLEEIEAVHDALYNRFSALRLSKGWRNETAMIKDRVATGLHARLPAAA